MPCINQLGVASDCRTHKCFLQTIFLYLYKIFVYIYFFINKYFISVYIYYIYREIYRYIQIYIYNIYYIYIYILYIYIYIYIFVHKTSPMHFFVHESVCICGECVLVYEYPSVWVYIFCFQIN